MMKFEWFKTFSSIKHNHGKIAVFLILLQFLVSCMPNSVNRRRSFFSQSTSISALSSGFRMLEDQSLTQTFQIENEEQKDYTISIFTPPSFGVVSISQQTDEFTYTPNPNYNGIDTFSYILTDQNGATTDPAQLTISVSPVQDAPVAFDETFLVSKSQPYEALWRGGIDPDNEDVTYILVQGPSHGTFEEMTNGRFRYSPIIDFTGTDTITYQVQDPQGALSEIKNYFFLVEDVDLPEDPTDFRFELLGQSNTPINLPVSDQTPISGGVLNFLHADPTQVYGKADYSLQNISQDNFRLLAFEFVDGTQYNIRTPSQIGDVFGPQDIFFFELSVNRATFPDPSTPSPTLDHLRIIYQNETDMQNYQVVLPVRSEKISSNCAPNIIPVRFVFIRDPSNPALDNVDMNAVNHMITILNLRYTTPNSEQLIEFQTAEVNSVRDDDFYVVSSQNLANIEDFFRTRTELHALPGFLNVFVAHDLGDFLGLAWLDSPLSSQLGQSYRDVGGTLLDQALMSSMMMTKSSIFDFFSVTPAHEIGHIVGLYHTSQAAVPGGSAISGSEFPYTYTYQKSQCGLELGTLNTYDVHETGSTEADQARADLNIMAGIAGQSSTSFFNTSEYVNQLPPIMRCFKNISISQINNVCP